MILTDREIAVALREGQITIRPAPIPDSFASSSVDLTFADLVKVWRRPDADGAPGVLSPGEPDYAYAQVSEQFAEDVRLDANGRVLQPGDFLLAWTEEYVELPIYSRIAARVEGKSSIARIGIGGHVTAPPFTRGSRVKSNWRSSTSVRCTCGSPPACRFAS